MKDQLIAARLPDTLVEDLAFIEAREGGDRSAAVRRLLARAVHDWKLEYYAGQYTAGLIGVAGAAAAAGVPVWQMMEYLRAKKVPAQYDLHEWQADVEDLFYRPDIDLPDLI